VTSRTYRYDDADGGFLSVDRTKTPDAAGVVFDARDCFVPLMLLSEVIAAIQGKARESASENGQPMTASLTDQQLAEMQARFDRGAVLRWGDIAALLADNARLRAELEQARAKVRAVEQVRCWTNEDGKRFVFADDLLAAVEAPAPARTCGARPVHQTGSDTDQDN
jgi:hypothetical protein